MADTNNIQSKVDVQNDIDKELIEEEKEHLKSYFKVEVYKGYSAKYKHDVLAVKIIGKLLNVEKTFYYSDFSLNFKKVVLPFLAATDEPGHYDENIIKRKADYLVKDFKEVKTVDDIDAMVETTSKISDEDVKIYYENLNNFINDNEDLFAEKTDTDNTDNVFDKKFHYGAWIDSEYYKDKYEPKKSLLAVCTNKFKIMADIDENRHLIKDVVRMFVKKGYILTGTNSSTVEKDLTLSKGNEVRCYIIDCENPQRK